MRINAVQNPDPAELEELEVVEWQQEPGLDAV